eukprot:m.56194 g.56194  ORF g.56194 m.56194 type:complete len:58 (+) comp12999_c0_seq1:106-279(+)
MCDNLQLHAVYKALDVVDERRHFFNPHVGMDVEEACMRCVIYNPELLWQFGFSVKFL